MPGCASLIRTASNYSEWLGACLQAAATRRAGTVQAHAIIEAGLFGLAAAIVAIIGAGIGAGAVVWNGRQERKAALGRLENEHKISMRQMAAVYSAEIEGLWTFFKDVDLLNTLKERVVTGEKIQFSPGASWLKTYANDPSTIRVFEPALAGLLAYTLTRSLNELGRLEWLHKWQDTGTQRSKQYEITIGTLCTLEREANDILARLNSIIACQTTVPPLPPAIPPAAPRP